MAKKHDLCSAAGYCDGEISPVITADHIRRTRMQSRSASSDNIDLRQTNHHLTTHICYSIPDHYAKSPRWILARNTKYCFKVFGDLDWALNWIIWSSFKLHIKHSVVFISVSCLQFPLWLVQPIG